MIFSRSPELGGRARSEQWSKVRIIVVRVALGRRTWRLEPRPQTRRFEHVLASALGRVETALVQRKTARIFRVVLLGELGTFVALFVETCAKRFGRYLDDLEPSRQEVVLVGGDRR